MSSKIKIYHNPACSKSRNTLALIRNTGQEPEIIDYLKTPPSKTDLMAMITQSGLSVRDVIRKDNAVYENLKLDQTYWNDEQLIDFMIEHPLLINRPFVVTERGVRLCRPPEIVLEIL